jgi:hypothetical protein
MREEKGERLQPRTLRNRSIESVRNRSTESVRNRSIADALYCGRSLLRTRDRYLETEARREASTSVTILALALARHVYNDLYSSWL